MAVYSSFNSLINKVLEYRDTIIFTVGNSQLEYRVEFDHLSHFNNDNSLIFKLLKLDKYPFCSKAYGYNTNSGIWPCFNIRDFAAATRCVLALYAIIEKKIYHEPITEPITEAPKKEFIPKRIFLRR